MKKQKLTTYFFGKFLVWGIGIGGGSVIIKSIIENGINNQMMNFELYGEIIVKIIFFFLFSCLWDLLFKRDILKNR